MDTSTQPQKMTYESMGTMWNISVWDPIEQSVFQELQASIIDQSTQFDHTYSRFIKSSLIWQLTEKRGVVEVPTDLVRMLRLYETLNTLTKGKCNPLVGFALSDLGYDASYTLKPKEHIRPVPDLHSTLTIIDDTHIELHDSVLIDLGALGKGYFVDVQTTFLRQKGMRHFLVDGSGDIYYSGNGVPLRAGLEHPGDATKVIGVMDMMNGAMCSSASNRRKWHTYHHTIDPDSLTSTDEILATWVTADTAALADGLATCLFLTEPERLQEELSFEYCILNKDYKIKRSTGFTAELF